MRLLEIVETSRQVAATSARLEKIERLAALLRQLAPTDVEVAVGFLSGIPRQGRIGIGWSSLDRSMPPAAEKGTLTPVPLNMPVTGVYCLPIVSCAGFSVDRQGRFADACIDFF